MSSNFFQSFLPPEKRKNESNVRLFLNRKLEGIDFSEMFSQMKRFSAYETFKLMLRLLRNKNTKQKFNQKSPIKVYAKRKINNGERVELIL